VAYFRDYYGPTHKAFLSLDPSQQARLTADLLDLVARYNTARDGSMRVPSSYSEIIIVKAQ
jgi:hypothetical protein